ncbi:MAG: tetratricopeptide repeat protein, partial [Ignavibacteria bacterium]|nr:tetratricopeptide repeat protein [Ignavibacteria bacterium]
EKYKKTIELDPNYTLGYNNWGLALQRQEKYEEAIEKYKKTIELDPNYTLGYNNWGIALEKQEKYEEAIEKYKKAIELDLNYAMGYINWGLALEALYKFEEAIAKYRKAVEIDPKYVDAYNTWGVALERQGKYEEAIEKYKKAIELDPNYTRGYSNWGLALAALYKFEEAIEKYIQAVKIDPQYDKAYLNWSKIIYKLELPDKYFNEFRKTIKRQYNKSSGRNHLGVALLNLRRFDEAIIEFQKVIEKDPKNAAAYNNWGLALDKQKEFKEAIEKYRTAVEIDPNYITPYSNWSNAISKVNEIEKYYEEFRRKIESQYDKKDGHSQLGNLLINLKRYEEAKVEYNKVLKLNPKDIIAHSNLGFILQQQKKYKEAILKFKKAVKIDPTYKYAYSGWAQNLTKLDDPDLENELYELRKMVEKHLNNEEGFNVIGRALHDLDRYDEANQFFEKAIALSQDFSDAYFNWGNSLLDQLRYEEALDKFNLSWKCDPNYFYPIHNYAHIYGILGKYKLAKEKWRKALEVYSRFEGDAITLNDSNHFLYEGTIFHHVFQELDEAENLYQTGLKIDRGNIAIHLELCKLYFEKKSDELGNDENSRERRNYAHTRAWNVFRAAESLLLKKIKDTDETQYHFQLAQLYSTAGYYTQALKYLSNHINRNKSDAAAYAERGLVEINIEKYKKAVSSFETAVELSPDNLDYRSNLAKSYLKLNSYAKSELEYRKVLVVSSFHMDSILGISELYITMGDSYEANSNDEDSVERYSQSINYLNEARLLAIDANYNSNDASKKLNNTELSELYYSLGYAKIRTHELQKESGNKLLKSAKKVFNKVGEGTQNYYKASRAINKIQERISEKRKPGSRIGAYIVVGLSVIVFLIAQGAFFIGRPVIQNTAFSFNPQKFDSLIVNENLEVPMENQISILSEKYLSADKSFKALSDIIGKDKLDKIEVVKILNIIDENEAFILKEFDPIDSALYATLTFGSIIFMIAGLYLKEMTKLRLGAIELEKTSGQEVTISSSLGINR